MAAQKIRIHRRGPRDKLGDTRQAIRDDGAQGLRPARADLIARVRSFVAHGQLAGRNDLRYRIADALAAGLRMEAGDAPVLLPSQRTLARELNVHRNTMSAALQLLVRRGIVEELPGGRFAVPVAQCDDGRPDSHPEPLISQAATLAVRRRITQAAFVESAVHAYRRAAQHCCRVVLVDPTEQIPGMDAVTLSAMLGHPVEVTALAQLLPELDVVYVAAPPEIDAVRAKLRHVADTFAIGLSFDADLRIATADLEPGATVVVVADNESILRASVRRLHSFRPDIVVTSRHELRGDLPQDASLVLALDGADVSAARVPVARFSCAISPTEIMLLRAKLASRPWSETEAGPLERPETVPSAPETSDTGRARSRHD